MKGTRKREKGEGRLTQYFYRICRWRYQRDRGSRQCLLPPQQTISWGIEWAGPNFSRCETYCAERSESLRRVEGFRMVRARIMRLTRADRFSLPRGGLLNAGSPAPCWPMQTLPQVPEWEVGRAEGSWNGCGPSDGWGGAGDPASPHPASLPGTIAPPAYPAPILRGAMIRLSTQVQNIRSGPRFTETICQDPGIIAVDGSIAPTHPTLAPGKTAAGNVTLNWNEGGWTGMNFQRPTGSGNWVDVGGDLHSPFVDTRPLRAPSQPERSEYHAGYLDGDTVQAGTSQVIEVTFSA